MTRVASGTYCPRDRRLLLFPLVVLAAAGLRASGGAARGWELPGTVLVSVGLGLITVVATLTTDSATIAPVTTPLVVVLALAVYRLGRRRLRALRPDGWALGGLSWTVIADELLAALLQRAGAQAGDPAAPVPTGLGTLRVHASAETTARPERAG